MRPRRGWESKGQIREKVCSLPALRKWRTGFPLSDFVLGEREKERVFYFIVWYATMRWWQSKKRAHQNTIQIVVVVLRKISLLENNLNKLQKLIKMKICVRTPAWLFSFDHSNFLYFTFSLSLSLYLLRNFKVMENQSHPLLLSVGTSFFHKQNHILHCMTFLIYYTSISLPNFLPLFLCFLFLWS